MKELRRAVFLAGQEITDLHSDLQESWLTGSHADGIKSQHPYFVRPPNVNAVATHWTDAHRARDEFARRVL
jgi:hypothetical protein